MLIKSLEIEFHFKGARNLGIYGMPVPICVKIIKIMESHPDELKKEKEKDIFKELDKFCQRTFRLK